MNKTDDWNTVQVKIGDFGLARHDHDKAPDFPAILKGLVVEFYVYSVLNFGLWAQL